MPDEEAVDLRFGMSQLPFGFRTNWDMLTENGYKCLTPKVSIAFRLSDELGLPLDYEDRLVAVVGLNCLSAFGRIGTTIKKGKQHDKHSDLVSIAFRLSDELGPALFGSDTAKTERLLVSIAFRLSDELGHNICHYLHTR